ncbi:MAG: hypothetical protein OXR73_06375 [Myxococcales bacterium]|nr:hypothetical protein [Myxococcales bacterium]
MNLLNLIVLYLLMGLVCAVAIRRREPERGGLWAAVVAVPLWPLWAPFVLAEERPKGAVVELPSARIEAALREGVQAADGTALDVMLNGAASERISRTVRRVAARLSEVRTLLARPEFDLLSARQRVEQTQARDGARALATARLQLANAERLHAMATRDEQALDELADLTEALRTQLLMIRLSGSSADAIGDIVSDLWTRLEALHETMDRAG